MNKDKDQAKRDLAFAEMELHEIQGDIMKLKQRKESVPSYKQRKLEALQSEIKSLKAILE